LNIAYAGRILRALFRLCLRLNNVVAVQ